jgi:urease accessory protein
MRADAALAAGPGRLTWRDAPPVVIRPTGPGRVHLVQAAGGPLGGDQLSLTAQVGEKGRLRVSSVAATVVQPGVTGDPARWRVDLEVAARAEVDWQPQPTVLTDGARLHSDLRVRLAEGAVVSLRETVILGRAGQAGGRYQGGLTVTVGSRVLLRHESLLDGADPQLCGPAGTGGHRVYGTLLVAGVDPGEPRTRTESGVRWARMPLDGPGYLVLALGDSATAVGRVLASQANLPSRDRHAASTRQIAPAEAQAGAGAAIR